MSASDPFEGTFGSGRGRPAEPSGAGGDEPRGVLDVLADELFAGLDIASVWDRAEELGATVRQERILLSNPLQSQSWELDHPDLQRPVLLVAEWSLNENPPGFDEEADGVWQPVVRRVQSFVLDRRWDRPST